MSPSLDSIPEPESVEALETPEAQGNNLQLDLKNLDLEAKFTDNYSSLDQQVCKVFD